MLDSVFNAGNGASFVDAWCSTTTDIEEVLANARHGGFHIFLAGVVKSIVRWVGWDFQLGFGRSTLVSIVKFGSSSNQLLGLDLLGPPLKSPLRMVFTVTLMAFHVVRLTRSCFFPLLRIDGTRGLVQEATHDRFLDASVVLIPFSLFF